MKDYSQGKINSGDIIEPISYTQKNFLDYCKKIGFGDITIILRDGQPVQAINGNESCKIDINDTWKLTEYLKDIKDADVTLFINHEGNMRIKKIIKKKRFDLKPEE